MTKKEEFIQWISRYTGKYPLPEEIKANLNSVIKDERDRFIKMICENYGHDIDSYLRDLNQTK